MTKVIFIAKRKSHLTVDEFNMYWQQVHAPLVARIPGVRGYVMQAVTSATSSEVEPICDGIAEIWFESLAVMRDAEESKEGQAAAADVSRFCAPESGAVVVDEIPN